MVLPSKGIVEAADSAPRLEDLTLSTQGIQVALREGARYLASLTPHDTVVIRGMGVYNAINRALADIYCTQGWRVSDYNGFRRLVHPEGELSVVVHGGDWRTGISTEQPSNGYPYKDGARKGIRDAVKRNKWLVLQSHFQDADEDFGGRGWTYLLLHHIDCPSSIQAELILPTRIDNGFITEYHERIIIPDPSEDRDLSIDEGAEETFEVELKQQAPAG